MYTFSALRWDNFRRKYAMGDLQGRIQGSFKGGGPDGFLCVITNTITNRISLNLQGCTFPLTAINNTRNETLLQT